MKDDLVERALKELRETPPPGASPGFEGRVWARFDLVLGRRRRRARIAAALFTTGAAATVLLLVLARPGDGPRPHWSAIVDGGAGDLDREVAQLWREQRALAAELESLRASPQPESSSIIYVGHADGIDLVLDLDLVADTSAKRRSSP